MNTKESVFSSHLEDLLPTHTHVSVVKVCIGWHVTFIKHLNDDSKVRANRPLATQSGDNNNI